MCERERKGRRGIAEGQGVGAHDSGGDGGEVVHVEGLGRGAAGAVGGRVVAIGAGFCVLLSLQSAIRIGLLYHCCHVVPFAANACYDAYCI